MMIISRPNSSLYLRHLDRISCTEIAGVSSMISLLSPILPALSIRSAHSASVRSPVRIFCASTWDSMEKRRFVSCSLDISSEKIAAHRFSLRTTCCAIFRTSAVLPIEGLAAIRIRSEFWNPAVRLSRSVNPVDSPVTLPLIWLAYSIFSIALRTIWRIGTKPEESLLWEISKIFFSAWFMISSSSSFWL